MCMLFNLLLWNSWAALFLVNVIQTAINRGFVKAIFNWGLLHFCCCGKKKKKLSKGHCTLGDIKIKVSIRSWLSTWTIWYFAIFKSIPHIRGIRDLFRLYPLHYSKLRVLKDAKRHTPQLLPSPQLTLIRFPPPTHVLHAFLFPLCLSFNLATSEQKLLFIKSLGKL